MKLKWILGLFATALALAPAGADIVTQNAATPAGNDSAYAAWLADIGISAGDVEYLVDFESGFTEGQNVSGVSGLFPGGLVIVDSDADAAVITGLSSNLGGSNPIDSLAVSQNERPFLILDLTARPVDYVSFFDIDQSGTAVTVEFVGGGSANTSFETTGTGGNSAEFFGIFRNDMPQIERVLFDASGDAEWGVDNIRYGRSAATDIDADGVPDSTDNCIEMANPAQRDTDADNIGNACDADLNNDCIVNVLDLGLIKVVFFGSDSDADFNGDGVVNTIDLGIMKLAFFDAPGPSALANACD